MIGEDGEALDDCTTLSATATVVRRRCVLLKSDEPGAGNFRRLAVLPRGVGRKSSAVRVLFIVDESATAFPHVSA
jgi:hypothetical protein